MAQQGTRRPVTVGIAGGSAAGKSTFAADLLAALPELRVTCIHQDRYFRKERPRHVAPFASAVHDDHNHPDSFELERFRADLDAAQADEQWQVVLVEGLLVLQDDVIRSRLDLKLFVDCRSDERLFRRIKRNLARQGENLDQIATFFLESVRFRHDEYVEPSRWHADLVLNGAVAPRRGLEVVAVWIRQAVAARPVAA